MNSHLKTILTTLSKNRVKFVVCGGVALVLHGIERVTMDIDISVPMDSENLQGLISTLKELGMTPRAPIPAESLLDPEKRKIMTEEKGALVFTFIDTKNPYKQVDIFLGKDDLYAYLVKDAVAVPIQGTMINIISIEDLINMKKEIKPPRGKDIHDINELQKLLKAKDEK
jgi:predicted nucleotidyltransferase